MNALQPPRRGADTLAIAFATTVAMWSLLYVAALPAVGGALWLAIGLGVVGCLFVAGWLAGRYACRGAGGGAVLGLVIAGVSLLILLGLLGDEVGEHAGMAALWILGLLAAAVGLCSLGAVLGCRRAAPPSRDVNWTSMLAWVTAITTLFMLASGGIVTGLEAGLAVDGWLIAEGHVLVLFPITLMQRDADTFVEHAHRLWGLLVGLTTIVLMVHLWMVDRRRWVHGMSLAIVLAVVVQGILGGTRVTEQSVVLAMVHGVVAQVIFATLVATAMATSTTWIGDRAATVAPTVGADRTLTVALLAVILLQIVLGTLYRHLHPVPGVPTGALMGLLHGHSFVTSLLVVLIVLFCGVRSWGLYPGQPVVKRAGMALSHTLILQVILGIASFVVVPKGPRDHDDAITVVEIVITTAHQVTGAILLASAAALFVWQRRLLGPGPAARSSGRK